MMTVIVMAKGFAQNGIGVKEYPGKTKNVTDKNIYMMK